MLPSYHAEPKKPEKSTKIDYVRDKAEKKEIANVEKKDRGDNGKSEDRKHH